MRIYRSPALRLRPSAGCARLSACLMLSALALPAYAAQAQEPKTGYSILYDFSTIGGRPYNALLPKNRSLYGLTLNGGTGHAGAIYQIAPNGTETTLYNFTGGNDGGFPYSLQNLIADKNGNLYGTTSGGGVNGVGTVFKLAPDGTETVLHSFSSDTDGDTPYGGVIMDGRGNLYGTTTADGPNGGGTVYKLTAAGAFKVLWSFGAGDDGNGPYDALFRDKSSGDLYGTTLQGGIAGSGTVFKLTPGGVETILHSFTGGSDGLFPASRLVTDASGNLYGTTNKGGLSGGGTIFKVAPDGTETVLFAFNSTADGGIPQGLAIDGAGNLYGTAQTGGANNKGTVFELAADGTETTLHTFAGDANDGGAPYGGVTVNKAGTLIFGTTTNGGGTGCGGSGCGTVFRLVK